MRAFLVMMRKFPPRLLIGKLLSKVVHWSYPVLNNNQIVITIGHSFSYAASTLNIAMLAPTVSRS